MKSKPDIRGKSLNPACTACSSGVKHLHEAAAKYDVGVYWEANGHGTVIFSPELLAKLRQLDLVVLLHAASDSSAHDSCLHARACGAVFVCNEAACMGLQGYIFESAMRCALN
eukprot:364734-Chlamydomonas_euryale.AAC.11